MKILIHTEGWFDSAHFLENYVGKCANLHGHTYKIEVWVRGEEEQLDKVGILWDFGNLKSIINGFDHKLLNDFYNKEYSVNSTAENQALIIYKLLKEKDKKLEFVVRVYEQLAPKKSWAQVGDFDVY